MKILYAFLFSPMRATVPVHLILLDYVMKLVIMQFSPTLCHFIPFRSNYSQRRVLK
jgi:hypothetical protein